MKYDITRHSSTKMNGLTEGQKSLNLGCEKGA